MRFESAPEFQGMRFSATGPAAPCRGRAPGRRPCNAAPRPEAGPCVCTQTALRRLTAAAVGILRYPPPATNISFSWPGCPSCAGDRGRSRNTQVRAALHGPCRDGKSTMQDMKQYMMQHCASNNFTMSYSSAWMSLPVGGTRAGVRTAHAREYALSLANSGSSAIPVMVYDGSAGVFVRRNVLTRAGLPSCPPLAGSASIRAPCGLPTG